MVPRCPVCGTPGGGTLLELRGVPALCNVQWATPNAAREAPSGSIHLKACGECGGVWNASFDESLLAYQPGYENSLFASPLFSSFADELVGRLGRHVLPAGGHVLEVGCGDGEFLARVCERTGSVGTGIDPSAVTRTDVSGRVRVEARRLSRCDMLRGAELVLLRHVLEHLPEPLDMLSQLRHVVGRRGGVLYVEVPNARSMFEEDRLFDVIYEHVLYFSPVVLGRALRRVGMQPLDTGDSFGRQYAWSEAVSAGCAAGENPPLGRAGHPDRDAERREVEAVVRLGEGFAQRVPRVLEGHRQRLESLAAKGPCVVWGSGSKGVMFLNLLDPRGDLVTAAVDRNPRKQGRYVAGTGHRILAPAALADSVRPASVLAANPLYTAEIRAELDDLGIAAEVLPL